VLTKTGFALNFTTVERAAKDKKMSQHRCLYVTRDSKGQPAACGREYTHLHSLKDHLITVHFVLYDSQTEQGFVLLPQQELIRATRAAMGRHGGTTASIDAKITYIENRYSSIRREFTADLTAWSIFQSDRHKKSVEPPVTTTSAPPKSHVVVMNRKQSPSKNIEKRTVDQRSEGKGKDKPSSPRKATSNTAEADRKGKRPLSRDSVRERPKTPLMTSFTSIAVEDVKSRTERAEGDEQRKKRRVSTPGLGVEPVIELSTPPTDDGRPLERLPTPVLLPEVLANLLATVI
jgi:hypothetical protein